MPLSPYLDTAPTLGSNVFIHASRPSHRWCDPGRQQLSMGQHRTTRRRNPYV